jgi:hypothetical protein
MASLKNLFIFAFCVLFAAVHAAFAQQEQSAPPAQAKVTLQIQWTNLPPNYPLSAAVELTLHKTKTDALNNLARFEQARETHRNLSFRDWLARAKENYATQLSAVAKSAS